MTDWSPPSIPRELLAGFVGLYVLVVAYAVLIQGQLLLTIWIGSVAISLYLLWRFLYAIEGIADALQRIANQQEQH